jgi:hypothetical protein
MNANKSGTNAVALAMEDGIGCGSMPIHGKFVFRVPTTKRWRSVNV